MSQHELTRCPNCGRTENDGYGADPATCELWAHLRKGYALTTTLFGDCFRHTTKRVNALLEVNRDRTAALTAAQKALSRHHEAEAKKTDPFPDNARIE